MQGSDDDTAITVMAAAACDGDGTVEDLDSDGSHDHRRPCWRYTIWDYRAMILMLVGDLLVDGG